MLCYVMLRNITLHYVMLGQAQIALKAWDGCFTQFWCKIIFQPFGWNHQILNQTKTSDGLARWICMIPKKSDLSVWLNHQPSAFWQLKSSDWFQESDQTVWQICQLSAIGVGAIVRGFGQILGINLMISVLRFRLPLDDAGVSALILKTLS